MGIGSECQGTTRCCVLKLNFTYFSFCKNEEPIFTSSPNLAVASSSPAKTEVKAVEKTEDILLELRGLSKKEGAGVKREVLQRWLDVEMRRKEASLALPLAIALLLLFWLLMQFHLRHFHGQPVTATVRRTLRGSLDRSVARTRPAGPPARVPRTSHGPFMAVSMRIPVTKGQFESGCQDLQSRSFPPSPPKWLVAFYGFFQAAAQKKEAAVLCILGPRSARRLTPTPSSEPSPPRRSRGRSRRSG